MKKLIALLVSLMMIACVAMASAETVTVAFNPEYPPFEFVEGDAYLGYDVDLITAVAAKAGFDLEFEAMDFDAVTSAVMANPSYIGVSGISITEERLMNVDFSNGYINAGLIVVIKDGSGYATVEDLKGKTIGVQMGTTSDFAAEEITGAGNVAQYKTFLNAIMDLQGDKVDAVIVDKPVGLDILASLDDASLVIVDMGLQADWYGIEVNKENTELLEKINAALTELEAEGFFTELETKYFTGADVE
ncbi:MAG: transporter substrate-binding domain-containing protein [Clostridia bacterium]|nr:transporter substrate-binding domain-containing protein [Clostridia bacterium]